MSEPPVKKRAGDLAATSPNNFHHADDTALVCAAQTHISNETLRRWFAEAERIASEHHRSQNVRHLRAFCRMIGGIMQEIEKALPR